IRPLTWRKSDNWLIEVVLKDGGNVAWSVSDSIGGESASGCNLAAPAAWLGLVRGRRKRLAPTSRTSGTRRRSHAKSVPSWIAMLGSGHGDGLLRNEKTISLPRHARRPRSGRFGTIVVVSCLDKPDLAQDCTRML